MSVEFLTPKISFLHIRLALRPPIPEDESTPKLSGQGRLNSGGHMTCTTCSAKLPKGTAYCGSCGTRTAMEKRRESLAGMLFDRRYRIESKLAAGGFGAIYRATNVLTGREVALKVLHPDLASDPTLSARFRREATVLASLRDPHTIKTYEHGENRDGTPYIVMELLTGKSLQAELHEQGPLPWRRTLSIMRGVCSSLKEAHALGLVHRDLKPANIHLERRGDEADFVKVLDFGIVKVLGSGALTDELDITRVGQAVGTLDYMSPEQITGGETDHRTDIYALGVVAYEMLTGRRPFTDATTPTSLLTALMTRTPVAPSTLFHRDCFPAAVDQLLMRCLELDAAYRFANVSEVVEAIDEILAHAAATAEVAAAGTTTLPGPGSMAARRSAQPSAPLPPLPRPPLPRPSTARPSAPRPSTARPSAPRSPMSRSSMVQPTMSLAAESAPVPPMVQPPVVLAPVSRPSTVPPSGARSVPPMFASLDDGEVTNVDVVPLFDVPWEPALDRVGDRLARTPYLDTPPEPPTFKAARGSTVSVSPYQVPAAPQPQPQLPQLAALKLSAWVAALLASGVGLGMLVASLC
jgi:serine/threonine-protein kinase